LFPFSILKPQKKRFDYDNVEAEYVSAPKKEAGAPGKKEPAATLDRFSVAPPLDAAPLPPGSAAPLPPRSVVGPKRTNSRK
jgi:hypothetical protein